MKILIVSLAILSIGFGCNNPQTQDKNKVMSEDNSKTSSTSIEEKADTTTENSQSSISLSKYFNNDGGWIQINNALSADQTGLYVYFQAPNDVARNLRLRIQYGDQSIYKFVVDGNSYTYKANRSQNSDNRFVEGSSFSWYDADVKNKDYKFLEALSKSKNAKVILNDGNSLSITEDTKQAIKKSFEYFETLDGLLPKTNMVNIRR